MGNYNPNYHVRIITEKGQNYHGKGTKLSWERETWNFAKTEFPVHSAKLIHPKLMHQLFQLKLSSSKTQLRLLIVEVANTSGITNIL